LQVSESEDEATRDREDRQYEMMFKSDYDDYRERATAYKSMLYYWSDSHLE
jgi:hypothetical protein